ncbi:hypothetical protein [Synechococcus sp. PCC 7336]|uniref:hypothetical protein n=1 Tax=Synechococcus sp. PCC 7336 TaxID=195250 RepID=UPI00034D0BFF|nr:hypothetical protein [Synechococcus sp. PCC 7336]
MKSIKLFGSVLTAFALVSTSPAAFAGDWSDAIAEDPHSFCSDVGLGHNIDSSSGYYADSNEGSRAQNNIFESHTNVSGANASASSSYRHTEGGGGGGVSFLGIGVSGSGRSERTTRTSNERENNWDNTYDRFSDTSTTTTWANGREFGFEQTSAELVSGSNCDAVVLGAAQIETTRMQTEAMVEISTQNNTNNLLHDLLN